MLVAAYILLAVLLALQGADVWTTNTILSQGGVELNPVEAWCIHVLGKAWWVPKATAVTAAGAFAVLALPALAAALTLGGLVVLYGWVVLHNLGQFKK